MSGIKDTEQPIQINYVALNPISLIKTDNSLLITLFYPLQFELDCP